MTIMSSTAEVSKGNCQNQARNSQAPTEKTNTTAIFGLVIATAFLDIVDFSIIQVALPTIREQIAISLPDSQGIVVPKVLRWLVFYY
jgi:hypothetical protein